MLDHKHTFSRFFRQLLAAICPEVNFYPEPNFQVLKYPAVVFHWGSNRKTNTLSMWSQELQIDILYTDWKRAECDLTTQKILESLNLAEDVPGRSRRTPKVKYIDEEGEKLTTPQPYIPYISDIQWRMPVDSTIDLIYEDDKPELMHNTFTIYLYYKNR